MDLSNIEALQARVDAQIEAYQRGQAEMAEASLLLIAALIRAQYPEATRLWVDETDQDDSGHLVTRFIEEPDPDEPDSLMARDLDPVDSDLWGPCSNLDDNNKATWAPFFVDEGSTRATGLKGYLDLAKIVNDLATTPADDGRPAVVRRHYAVVLEDAVSFAIPAGIDVTNPAVNKGELFDQLYRLAKGAAPHEVGLTAALALAFNPAIAWEDEYQADVDSFDDTYEISYEPDKE